ncbi:MAG: ABC transporter substrate-binding protein [Myxococcales bacterium]
MRARLLHPGWPLLHSAAARTLALLLLGLLCASCTRERPPGLLRVGYYPNVTHAQALIGMETGMFQAQMPDGVRVEGKIFTSGPALIEALYSGSIDIGYIGPNPALNGFIHSEGRALRIIAGASSGGAAFVVRPDSGIRTAEDLRGKTVATPQLGNTQDVALRSFLSEHGLAPDSRGGDVRVVPMGNPDIFSMFKRGEIDGAWVAEPWGARLELDAGGRVFLDERHLWPGGRFVTAHVIARTRLVEEEPELVKAFLRGHVLATRRYHADPQWAQAMMLQHIGELSKQKLSPAVIERAMSRVEVTWDPVPASLKEAAEAAQLLGFLHTDDIEGIYDLGPLNEVLREQGLARKRNP